MKKADLVREVAGRCNIKQELALAVVNAAFDSIEQALIEGERVTIPGFGIFEIYERPPRTVRNPQTGEKRQAPVTRAARVRLSERLRALVKAAGLKKVAAS